MTVWLLKENRTKWVRFSAGEDPRKHESVHGFFYEKTNPVNHYILRSSYILENYEIVNLSTQEMILWQKMFPPPNEKMCAERVFFGTNPQVDVTGMPHGHQHQTNLEMETGTTT